MLISSPDAAAARAEAADWVELNALASGRRGFTYAELIGALDLGEHSQGLIDDGGEALEEEILETRYDEFCEAVLEELQWRQSCLGALYPFCIERTGFAWTLRRRGGGVHSERLAHATYLTCLMIATLRYEFLQGDGVEELVDEAPRIFQVLVMLASRGLLGGASSFWMGFPRPEGDRYGAALQRLVGQLGVGAVKSTAPASQRSAKDGGIDIVNWWSFADRRPVPVLSYGQVASGKRWTDKAVTTALDAHFHRWLEEHPAKYYIPTMFIPFMQHEKMRATRVSTFDEVVADRLATLEALLGLVVDRMRLTELAPGALRRASEADRVHAHEVMRWTARVRLELRRATSLDTLSVGAGA